MGVIEVSGIRAFGYHGCLPEEARIGGRYRIDVRVEGDFTEAERSDDLRDTIDYGRVTAIVREQLTIRSALIEQVARRILDNLQAAWPGEYSWRVRLVKEHPPVDGAVDEVAYMLESRS
ncbi:MAG TPA: dihydroneopterin aldolase [Flavobacteriales bacterium]|nr:dihydroneopterin aldolase [Flavobacteriales bacterium]